MTLCAIIGAGLVGEYAATRLLAMTPRPQVLGLRATRGWLAGRFPGCQFVGALEFQRTISLLLQVGATSVMFAGDISNSYGSPDLLAFSCMTRYRLRLHIPHSYLAAIKELLEQDNGIAIQSILTVLPELCAQPGLVLGTLGGYDPKPDLHAAEGYIGKLPWIRVRQAHIVDNGHVLMSENDTTDNLISSFGNSPLRHLARYPVLCAVSVQPFQSITLPTVGKRTAELCLKHGIRAIVIQAGNSILMQRDEVSRLTKNGSFCLCAV